MSTANWLRTIDEKDRRIELARLFATGSIELIDEGCYAFVFSDDSVLKIRF